jgi:hypothetical protein
LQKKYEWFLEYTHKDVEPHPVAWDPETGPPSDLLEEEIAHTAKFCLHYATPLPPRKVIVPGNLETASQVKKTNPVQGRLISEPSAAY